MIVTTGLGEVLGVEQRGASVFFGIPYGAAPVGELRFAPPRRREPWADVFDARRFGPRAPQTRMDTPLGVGVERGDIDEDCLRLNIYTPGVRGSRPVMVWLHGGGLVSGSANDYDATELAMDNDVVVVTVNYRLGLLGFADLSPCGEQFTGSASNGFRDQTLALEWIRDNISAFGGDPGCVTLFGQSGGAVSILALLGAPAADGLFHRAIVISGGPPQPAPPEVVPILAGTLDTDLTGLPAALRSVPLDRLLEIQQGIGFTAGGCVDGTVVRQFPAAAIRAKGALGVPIIAGSTRDEGTLLTEMMAELRPEVLEMIAEGLAAGTLEGADASGYVGQLRASVGGASIDLHREVWTDHFRRTAIRAVEAACDAGPGGWLYRFDLEPSGELARQLGVTHAADLGFVFNSMQSTDDAPGLYDAFSPTVGEVAARWSGTLASFARHGDPGLSCPAWRPYLPDRSCLIVDQDWRIERDIDRDRQAMWGDRTREVSP